MPSRAASSHAFEQKVARGWCLAGSALVGSSKSSHFSSVGLRPAVTKYRPRGAGLWETWKDLASGNEIQSCTILTCAPNEAMAALHDRIPVILDDADWPAWLGEESATPARLLSLLKPYEGRLKIWPVDRRVGNVRNKGAELALPI
jgi:hypothetical protein